MTRRRRSWPTPATGCSPSCEAASTRRVAWPRRSPSEADEWAWPTPTTRLRQRIVRFGIYTAGRRAALGEPALRARWTRVSRRHAPGTLPCTVSRAGGHGHPASRAPHLGRRRRAGRPRGQRAVEDDPDRARGSRRPHNRGRRDHPARQRRRPRRLQPVRVPDPWASMCTAATWRAPLAGSGTTTAVERSTSTSSTWRGRPGSSRSSPSAPRLWAGI